MSSNRTILILLSIIIIGGGITFAFTVPIIRELYLVTEQKEIGRTDDVNLEPSDYRYYHFTFAGATRVEYSVSASNTVARAH